MLDQLNGLPSCRSGGMRCQPAAHPKKPAVGHQAKIRSSARRVGPVRPVPNPVGERFTKTLNWVGHIPVGHPGRDALSGMASE